MRIEKKIYIILKKYIFHKSNLFTNLVNLEKKDNISIDQII